MAITLTEEGKRKAREYIAGLTAKRKEILDSGIDTALETVPPTLSDIESDISLMSTYPDGWYGNNWGVTDNYSGDSALWLKAGVDFIPTI